VIDSVSSGKASCIRVLHVDDDACFLEVSKEILMTEGNFEVDHALSVDEALKKLKTQNYDVIVSDYDMPQKDGLQFLKELHEQKYEIPFILFTGKGREEVTIQALNLGADGYHDKRGSPEAIYGELSHSIRLVVDRKKAKQALEESEKRYRTLMEHATDAILVHDKKGQIIDANQRACKNLGYTKEELLRMTIADIDDEAIENKKDILLWPKVIAGETFTFESNQKRKDRSTFPVEVSLGPITIGKETLVIGLIRNISERKKASEKINFQAALLKNVGQALIMVDNNWRIRYWNDAAEKLYGWSEEEALGHGITEILGNVSLQEEAEEISKRLMAGETWVNELLVTRKDGSVIPVIVSCAPFFNDQGLLVGAVSITTDISKWKKNEEDLAFALEALSNTIDKIQELNEKLRVMGSLTRHDVRNKLSTVTGYSYLLKKKHANEADVVNGLDKIMQAAKEIEKILEFAKLYEQLGAEELNYVNVEKAVHEATALFSGLTIKIVNDCHGLTVLADSFLRQLFYNLIDNTRKYGKTATTIRVSYEEADEESVKLIYEDDGVGISTENNQQLFKEGFSTGGSTGYGLFLIKKMIDVYGWTIEETGESGEGARFVMTIPKANKNGKEGFQIAQNDTQVKNRTERS
jgi:PAS domain S-box-containing protein